MCETLEICWLQWQLVSNPGDTARAAILIGVALIIVWAGAWYGCCRKTTGQRKSP